MSDKKMWYTTGEVARLLGITKQWVSHLARTGKLESSRLQEGGWHRISRESLEKYIQDNKIPVSIE